MLIFLRRAVGRRGGRISAASSPESRSQKGASEGISQGVQDQRSRAGRCSSKVLHLERQVLLDRRRPNWKAKGCVRTGNMDNHQDSFDHPCHGLSRYYTPKIRALKACSRSRKRSRCCARETDCPMVLRKRKNWRTSSKVRQKRAADAKLPASSHGIVALCGCHDDPVRRDY